MTRYIYPFILLPLLIPPAVFLICALGSGLSPAETAAALSEQFVARRQNLLLCGVPGLFPVLLLLAGLWLYRRSGGAERTRYWMAWGGFIPILLVLIWVNFQYWPLFLPERTYPGFPHGLEFIIGPVVFAPIGMLLGMGAGWWAARGRG